MKLARLLAPSVVFALALGLIASATAAAAAPRLKVSENRHFLVYEDGRPFFYLGDTAWELFHRLDREEADRYLQDRARKGFTVIQAVALAELDGLDDPNPYGHRPLRERRPHAAGRPGGPGQRLLGPRRLRRREGQRARAHDRLPPHVGRQVEQEVGHGPRDLHRRERGRLRGVAGAALPRPRGHLDPRRRPAGGDRGPQGDPPGDGARPAQGRRRSPPDDACTRRAGAAPPSRSTTTTGSTSTCGRTATSPSSPGATTRRGPTTTACRRSPSSTASRSTRTTPCRSTPRSSGTRSPPTCGGRSTGTSSRARAATPTATTRSGRCGRRDARPINNPLLPWFEAIAQPGAGQMQHARRLLESRPFLTRVPDDTVVVDRPRADVGARRGTLPLRGDAGRRGALRHGLRAGREAVQGEDVGDHGPAGQGLVVRTRATARPRRSASSRTRASARSPRPTPASPSTGCSCWTTRRRATRRPGSAARSLRRRRRARLASATHPSLPIRMRRRAARAGRCAW